MTPICQKSRRKEKVLLIFIYFLLRFLIHHRGNSLLAAPATSSSAAKVTTKISIKSLQAFHHGHVVFHWTQIRRCFPFLLHPQGSGCYSRILQMGKRNFGFHRRNFPRPPQLSGSAAPRLRQKNSRINFRALSRIFLFNEESWRSRFP